MKVSIITPTFRRPEFLRNAIEQYNNQDYPNKELILIIDSEDFWTIEYLKANNISQHDLTIYTMNGIGSTGQKRNMGVVIASGEIIAHLDDDDIYAPDWVTKSVMALQQSNGNVTGLARAFFKQGKQYYLWQNPVNSQPIVCEATMCYYRDHALKNPFPNKREGEGIEFCAKSIVRPHNYIEGFTAILHGNNTASHKQIRHMTPMPARSVVL